jgi:hypothetical protein
MFHRVGLVPARRVSPLGTLAVASGSKLTGAVTALISQSFGLDTFTACSGANASGLCCAFVSGVLSRLGVPLNPYMHGRVPNLEAALQALGWRVESPLTAPVGSVAIFQRPNDPVPWHGAFFVEYKEGSATFLESNNDLDFTPQTVRIRVTPAVLQGAVGVLATGEKFRIYAPPAGI